MPRSDFLNWCRGLHRALAAVALLMAGLAQAQHFDVELRTDKGPVAGSRIVAHFYGDLDLAGKLPIDALTGYRIFPAYFGDFAGGPYATANPGFQAFSGTFVQGEEVHFRALGTLLYWTPASGSWVPAPAGVKLTLYGGIPPEVVIGYSTNPAAWADQYTYYQGGTRYDGQGVTGPLTAAVDDAKAGGSFHSHLDWKISTTSGTPPVGAYMLTLELWSPAQANGQPKYLASQPIHIIFERGLSAAQMQAAFDSRVSPPCAARSMSWSVGANSCSASLGATASGLSATATDGVEPATGSATFACTNGSWGAATNASCTAPPAACVAQSLSWNVGGNSCSASVAASPSGTQTVVSDAVLPATGTASFSCSNGSWSAPGNASCSLPLPASCGAQTMSWSVGASSCSAAVSATASGGSALADDATLPTTGSARFACSDGSWGAATSASCTTAAPRACGAQTLSWQVGANSCSASAPGAASGDSASLTDGTAPATGGATFSCNDGTWSAPTQASCVAACTAQTLSWDTGGNRCSAAVPQTLSGAATTATDSATPATGSARFACSNGQWSAAADASCTAPPAACTAQTLSWNVGGNSCSAAVSETASGVSALATDGSAPATGSARFACSNGAFGAATEASCTVPPAACAAQTLNWSVGGNACSAAVSETASGASALATDGSAPATGSARFTCTNGSFGAATQASCTMPAPSSCAARPVSWNVGSESCSGSLASTPSGSAAVASDTEAPALGQATFSCSDGAWGMPTAAQCAVPAPPACSAQSLSWVVNGTRCEAPVTATASGASRAASDTTGPATGSATFACASGQWSSATNASCAEPPPPCEAQILSWSVSSNSCSAAASSLASGGSRTLDDTTQPTTGSATFTCTRGAWGAATSASCVAPPPPCAAQTLSWNVGSNRCSAAAGSLTSGSALTLDDTAQPTTGSATFACTQGAWGAATGASCTAPPQPCAGQAVGWSVAGSSCSAVLGTAPSGTSSTISDTTQPTTGVATFSCSSGAWSAAAQASCTTQPLVCPAATLGWAVGTQTCAAQVPESPSGTTRLATDDEAPASGSASFVCNNGLWSAPAAASCAAVKPLPAARTPAPPWAPPSQLPWDKPRR